MASSFDLRARRHDPRIFCFLAALSLILAGGTAAWAEVPRPTVAFLNPATPENIFWEKVTRLMRHGAEQLGMNLVVSYQSQEDITSRFSYVRAATQVLKSKDRPDYIVFLNMRDTGHRILKEAEAAGVKSMIILSDIHEDERQLFGVPRGKFRHWIGHLVSDDRQAGYLLADRLLNLAQQHNPQTPVELVGINGSINGTAAELRAQGLAQAMAEHAKAKLHTLVNSRTWLRADGREKALVLLRRHPATNVIWAASDSLALGARDAAGEINGPGEVSYIGGIDWTDEALEAVANGQLTLSVGGHLLESLIAMVLLYDHYHGHDFVSDPGSRFLTPMAVADRSLASTLQQRMNADLKAVNLRRLSKYRNDKLKRYDFSIDNILELPPAEDR